MTQITRTQMSSATRRRGVTLVEMLVTLAILVIIMTVLVQVFQAATGALSAVQAYQQIDDQFRRVDGMLRSDLEGVTAHFTPPLNPTQNLGYFEYGENEFADVQGEDSDDFIRFTAKAPEGRPFTGRMWVTGGPGTNSALVNGGVQPVTVTSDYAEIIYFLRNGNLYRRVLLIAPELQSTISQVISNQVDAGGTAANAFAPSPVFGGASNISWLGVNDLSARPAARGAAFKLSTASGTGNSIVLNTLADLTNRENRWPSPRFSDDFATISGSAKTGTISYAVGPDGLSDDQNGDNAPDYYPTLYPNAFNATAGSSTQLIFEPLYPNVTRAFTGVSAMAFPFIFPGAYSVPQAVSADQYGWIHSPYPEALVFSNTTNCAITRFEDNPLAYLQSINHNPIDLGDNLPNLTNTSGVATTGKVSASALAQTWWGFPTWRETISQSWNDPTRQVNDNINTNPVTGTAAFGQPAGLTPRLANTAGPSGFAGVADDADLLPPMAQPGSWTKNAGTVPFSLLRRVSQPDCDALGGNSAFMGGNTFSQSAMWSVSWDDDLIMTGVRSFDIKAYDSALASYADLGWGDDVRSQAPWATAAFVKAAGTTAPFLAGNPDFSYLVTGGAAKSSAVYPPQLFINNIATDYINFSFAHEGRIPPLIEDNRLDAQFPNPTYVAFSQPFSTQFAAQYANISDGTNDTFTFVNYSSNIGDDNSGVIRLRRVWDSWSTAYTIAPANGVYNNPNAPLTTGNPAVPNPKADPLIGSPWGPNGGTPPIYPSYPPPYPAPLRGIQIQIRAVDPSNQRIKSLTIRQDFSDKL